MQRRQSIGLRCRSPSRKRLVRSEWGLFCVQRTRGGGTYAVGAGDANGIHLDGRTQQLPLCECKPGGVNSAIKENFNRAIDALKRAFLLRQRWPETTNEEVENDVDKHAPPQPSTETRFSRTWRSACRPGVAHVRFRLGVWLVLPWPAVERPIRW